MAKVKKTEGEAHNGKAYYIVKTAPILAVAYELEISNGVVIKKTQISRAEDLPAAAVGVASKKLWKQYQQEEGAESETD